jgi:hypothetical protein
MTETLREKLIRCGWVTPFSADTLVKLINKHCADVIRDAADQLTPYRVADFDGAGMARNKLLIIADELEGFN